MKRRSAADLGLVYKTRFPAEPEQPPVTTLSPEVQARWDAWCDARINKLLDEVYRDAIAQSFPNMSTSGWEKNAPSCARRSANCAPI